jgi:PBSX family phage terminase large subunit
MPKAKRGVNISSVIAPHFHGVHNAIKGDKYSEYWLAGGRGSTKSSFIPIEVILDIMKDPQANAIFFRKVGDTLRGSVYTNTLWAIDKLGVADFFHASVSPLKITYLPTGQEILFKGLDDPLKVKSIKARKGYFKNIWFEELEEYSNMKELRNVMQSLKRGGDVFNVFFSYNPPITKHHWVCEEKHPAHRLTHHSTYLTVPRDWLGEEFFKDAEALKENDYNAYRHEYLGESVGLDNTIIFNGKFESYEFDTPEDIGKTQYERFFFGADWGFAADPTTLIRSWVDDDILYIDYEAYGVGVEMDEIGQLFESVPESHVWPISADSARPDTISHVRKFGFNIKGASKGKGSIEDGIQYIKKFNKIVIHPRCKHTLEEFRRYAYKVDKKTQEILPIAVDDWNHCITGNTVINTVGGDIKIEDLVGHEGFVHCYDEESGEKTTSKFFDVRKTRENAEVFDIQLEDGRSIRATYEHPVFTQRGWVIVGNLTCDDAILDINIKP